MTRLGGYLCATVAAGIPATLAVYFATFIPRIAAGEVILARFQWVPSLGVDLTFRLDGLSLLFALLITGIGSLVMLYTSSYLEGDPRLGRLYTLLLLFMASMLGLVLADNVLLLFVFWELTSITSYLLIGFNHGRDSARAAALQALLVTGLGGLALLAGALLLGYAGGSFELSTLLERGGLREHPWYTPLLLLMMIAAFTKSAQFPFHFWLPTAMEAPTPVSAYLHSATMVKAGVYLLARLNPLLGETAVWTGTLVVIGGITMVLGAVLAYLKSDLKQILAYSTVSSLGILTLSIGLGTTLAMQAAIVYLLGHALFKGSLFLVAGAIDHAVGTRDITRLGGLGRAMPITAAAGLLAALSMAGLPPLFGFIGKELLLEAVGEAPEYAPLLVTLAVAAAMLTVAAAAYAGVLPFFPRSSYTPRTAHEPPPPLWFAPLALSLGGLAMGLAPGLVGFALISQAVNQVLGRPVPFEFALFHGVNLTLLFSAIAVAGGAALYVAYPQVRAASSWLANPWTGSPASLYWQSLKGLNAIARFQTGVLQNGYLRYYLGIILLTAMGLVGYSLFVRAGVPRTLPALNVRIYEVVVASVIVLGTISAVRARARTTAVASLGAVAFGVTLIFVLFGAPDVAMTQVLVETLTVILLVLLLYHLPRFASLSPVPGRIRDMAIAGAAGVTVAALVLAVSAEELGPRISWYFMESSWTLAHGSNVVNVILVDFRALDTLGEITVLAISGFGVYALLKLRPPKGE